MIATTTATIRSNRSPELTEKSPMCGAVSSSSSSLLDDKEKLLFTF